MILEVRAVPPIYKNGFVIACERTHDGVIIDPGDEVDELLAAVRDHDVHVTHILLTHAHIDHISGVDVAKEAFDAPVYLHQADLPLYERVLQQGAMFDFKVRPQPPIDVFYDMSPIDFGDYQIRLHYTPGHSPGGVTLEVGRKGQPASHLFVGDALFAGSIGRTDLAGGNYQQLMTSIVDVIFPLGEHAIVHPGHGPETTVAQERRTNPFVLDYLAGRPEA